MKEFVKAFLKAQSQMHHAKLDSTNPHFKSEYASLESVLDAIKPSLNANGLILIEKVNLIGEKLFITTQIIHESGEMIESTTPIITERPGPQALGSGISYARRYGLEALCAIGSRDDDGNDANVPPKPQPRPAVISAATSAPPKPKFEPPAGVKDRLLEQAKKLKKPFGNDQTKDMALELISTAQLVSAVKWASGVNKFPAFVEAAKLVLADRNKEGDLDLALGDNRPAKGDVAPDFESEEF